jgi:hypothetical protein
MGAGNARAAQRAIGRSVTNITGMALAVAVSESGVSAAMLSRPDWVEAPRAYARHASPEGTASYAASEKRGLLSEAEQCKARGEFGALMRRNRLHSSIPSSWRQHFSGADRAAHALPGFFRMVRHRISSLRGIGVMPPDVVHFRHDVEHIAQRLDTLHAAFVVHTARFKGVAATPPSVPTTVWLNAPKNDAISPDITPAHSLSSCNVSQIQ